MTFDQFKNLAIETLTSPQAAASKLLAWDIPRQVVWLGIALISVLNGLYYALLLPGMAQAGMAVPDIPVSPILLTLFILIIFSVMVAMMTFAGNLLGGRGDIDRIGKITVWLQGLRFLAQLAISLMSLILPLIGWLGAMALGIWGIWILLNFVAKAHEFSIPKAIGALAVTFIGLVLIMSVVSAALGLTPPVPSGEI